MLSTFQHLIIKLVKNYKFYINSTFLNNYQVTIEKTLNTEPLESIAKKQILYFG